MIEVKNLSKKFGRKAVLSNVELTLKEGTVTGLVGVNGAGKSTLLRLIAGVLQPDKGRILVDGEPRDADKNGAKIFFLPDDPYYGSDTTVKGLFSLYSVFYPQLVWKDFAEEATASGLDLKKPLRSYSKGMRRQLFALLALDLRPRYLLLDEAFDGLDLIARRQFIRRIGELVDKEGTAVLVASHSLRELEDFCDSYLLIDGGRIASQGALDEKLAELCRFSLAYDRDIDASLFEGLPILHYAQEGRFVRLLLKGEVEETENALRATGPVVLERQEVGFEDLFLGTSEGGKLQ